MFTVDPDILRSYCRGAEVAHEAAHAARERAAEIRRDLRRVEGDRKRGVPGLDREIALLSARYREEMEAQEAASASAATARTLAEKCREYARGRGALPKDLAAEVARGVA